MGARQARVLIVSPGAMWARQGASRTLPLKLRLAGLWTYLRRHDVDADVLDLEMELGAPIPSAEDSRRYLAQGTALIEERDFDLLAFSCWSSFEYLTTLELARHVRESRPETYIVVGGYHPTALPSDFAIPERTFDAVVRGEGEIALTDLALGPLNRSGTGLVVIDGVPAPLEDTAFSLKGYPYLEPHPLRLHLELSRGCPFQCAFCCGPLRSGRWRAHPVDVALEMTRDALRLRPQTLGLVDPCFGFAPQWRREFLTRLPEVCGDTPVWLQTRVETLSEDDLELLTRLRVNLQLGVETMSAAMAEIMRKTSDGKRYTRRAAALMDALNERGILTTVNLIVNHPGETPATAEENLSFFERFVAEHDRLSLRLSASAFMLYPGTHVATALAGYTARYGTQVDHPRWWTEPIPHLPAAAAVRASASLDDCAPWHRKLLALNEVCVERMPAGAKLTLVQLAQALGEAGERPGRTGVGDA